ncbi:MAG: ABC transporter ATP-binding protein [Gammaproteobacteria bacterium]|nr:ABC transporter ATP-binding protein [Gammaproteobacteria bacterium]
MSSLLSVENLSLRFGHGEAAVDVLRSVSFSIAPGEKYALVGESGSGKSVTALSILRLLEAGHASYPSGSIRFDGRNLLALSEDQIRQVRGRDIAMIFQEPMTALNPVYPIGEQLMEPLLVHQGVDRQTARRRMLELLDRVGLSEPGKRWDAFPHTLSGGQRQRVMIAMALACSPKLLVADEPTTALDVTIQLQILNLLDDIQKEFGMAVLLITHDLNLVRRFADRVGVMQGGRLLEEGRVTTLFESPQEEYTRMLLASRPTRRILPGDHDALEKADRLIEMNHIRCIFPVKSGFLRRQTGDVRAVDDVSISLRRGETLGIVGESGSGKSTLGYCLLRLQPCEGGIRFEGRPIEGLTQSALRPLRRDFQIVFQDPYSSLSPRFTVEQIIGEGLRVHFPQLDRKERGRRIVRAMEEVGLDPLTMHRYPHEFSGGQRQRIAIARVVLLEPKLIVLDEPTSALDVSVQKQVLDLLADLQRRHGMSYIFISHDLGVIRAVAHRIVVLRQGKIVEEGETETLFSNPREAYTQQLLRASLLN